MFITLSRPFHAAPRPAGSAADIQRFRKQGFQFFMTATDLELMAGGAAQLLGPVRGGKRSLGQSL